MRPYFRITVNGRDISSRVAGRLKALTITDKRGMEADQLTLEIDDHDGLMALPPLGALVTASIGWSPDGLVDKGRYIADEIGHQGPADVLSINARAANLRHGFKSQRSRSHHRMKLGQILGEVAGGNGLELVIPGDLATFEIPHVDQTNESDAHFITRLAQRYDALATIKEGKLLFLPAGSGKTASGKRLPTIVVPRSAGDRHHYQVNDRDKYTGVKAIWYDASTATEHSVLAGEADTTKTLRQQYSSEQEAMKAAVAALGRLTRGRATFSATLAVGRPEIITESPVQLMGYKPEIDRQRWIVSQATHTLNDSGLTTQLELESFD